MCITLNMLNVNGIFERNVHMNEFGEKLKQVRQSKNFTQQDIADKLYVTRQAVSRWECGARYPDLITARKISKILDVSVDELLSGEELRENIEKEPLLERSLENIVQTCLYLVAIIAYMLMCIFNIYSLFPDETLAHTPAGHIGIINIITVLSYFVYLAVLIFGLNKSVRNKMTAKMIGYIMWLPYIMVAVNFLMTYIDMQFKHNGHMNLLGWITDLLLPMVMAIYVLLYFKLENRRLPYIWICVICAISMGHVFLILRKILFRTTDLGFVVSTVHSMGKIGMIILLAYQAYIWDKKKKMAYRKNELRIFM